MEGWVYLRSTDEWPAPEPDVFFEPHKGASGYDGERQGSASDHPVLS